MRAQVDAVVQRETAALKARIDKAVADTREQVDQRVAGGSNETGDHTWSPVSI